MLLATIGYCQHANAQISFSHSAGGGLYSAGEKGGGWALMYAPRLNVVELGDELNLSVGTNIGLGFSMESNSRSGSGNSSFLLDLPILAEFNYGHASSEDASSDYGAFAGFGYGFNKMSMSEETAFGTASSSVSGSGLILTGGIRGIVYEQSVGLRVSYMLNSAKDGANILGIGLFYNFGIN